MSKLQMWKRAVLVVAAGATLGLGYGGGCLEAAVQRILVAVAIA